LNPPSEFNFIHIWRLPKITSKNWDFFSCKRTSKVKMLLNHTQSSFIGAQMIFEKHIYRRFAIIKKEKTKKKTTNKTKNKKRIFFLNYKKKTKKKLSTSSTSTR